MVDTAELTLQERTQQGKKAALLRKQGLIPGVVYGSSVKAQSVQAPLATVQKAYRQAGKHHPLNIILQGNTHLAIIKSVDVEPVKHTLRHVAFHIISQNQPISTEVPVVVTGEGETPAEKAGLVLLKTAETVTVEALPNNLPEQLVVDGQVLAAEGDRLTVADIVSPKNVTIQSDAETVLVTVFEPAALAAANEAAGGDAEEETIESETTEADSTGTPAESDKSA